MTSPCEVKALWELLAGRPTWETLSEQQHLQGQIEKEREALLFRQHELSPDTLMKLNLCRASVSRTMQRCPEAIVQWNEAQALVHEWLQNKDKLELRDLIHLNAVLCGSPNRGWRQGDIYTTEVKHISADKINAMMEAFYLHLESTLQTGNDLYAAFICRYWILSIHPFAEANGRTSQLFADFYLLRSGFLPQAFFCVTETFLIGEPKRKPYVDPRFAFNRFAKTILNAYKLVTEV